MLHLRFAADPHQRCTWAQVWDPEALADTSIESLQHRHKLSPYTGLPLHGRVAATFVRGHQVFSATAKKPVSPNVCGKPVLKHQL